jgi:predicted phage tail protein
MGAFYIVVGALVLYIKHFGAMELPSALAYGLGTLMVVYGIFRIWRGVIDMRQLPKRDMNRDFPSLSNKKEEN